MIRDKNILGEPTLAYWEMDDFVAAAFETGDLIKLSVSRKDQTDGIGWDELMQVKEFCGYGDLDAVELYPAKDAVLNTGNIRHLYIYSEPLELVIRNAKI